MKSVLNPAAWATLVSLGAALLASCSGPQSSTGGGSAIPSVPAPRYAAPDAQSGTSWMSPDAQNVKELIYLSDAATNSVFVYDYSTSKPIGRLMGFDDPAGQCVDAQGDVWITSSHARTVVQYPHGAIRPARTLTTQGAPVGCAVAPNGDLAIAENPGSEDILGGISIFKHASTLTARYSSPACGLIFPPGYDNKGNLFVECKDGDLTNVYEVLSGARSLERVQLNRTIYAPGGVAWDGKYITL
ncbi:MAG: hypothetical protein JO104_08750, partial [Candidatus Eremiobacteraeota bacterium]|nr:hypothetical protein [Candidatus Eremiobacteraeota bacterium]